MLEGQATRHMRRSLLYRPVDHRLHLGCVIVEFAAVTDDLLVDGDAKLDADFWLGRRHTLSWTVAHLVVASESWCDKLPV